jgi:4'-phosphopantetheinyl transferase EntD
MPPGSVLVEAIPAAWDGPLHPEEESAVARAAPARRREFSAGRWCARAALTGVALTDFPVLRGPNREPVWPPGIVGSITHCPGYCAAAVSRADQLSGIGIDAEVNRVRDHWTAAAVCTTGELASFPALRGIDAWLIAFSAKEAVFKLWFPLTGRMLWHHDVTITLDPGVGSFTARLVGPERPAGDGLLEQAEGRFSWGQSQVFSVAWLRCRRG